MGRLLGGVRMSEIRIEKLHFSYGMHSEVLKGLDFTIDERSTAIVGQNGAGKTTFVKLLKGLLRPSSGRILLDGKDIALSTAAGLAARIGMVFQNPNDQIFKNTVLDEVMFGPLQIGMSWEEAHKRSMDALSMTGLQDLEEKNPYDMGLSARKLIAVASVLAMHTDIVIFDEPTIAQDYVGKERIKRIIRELRREGRTVITIIHDMDFVAEVFERVIVFADGKMLLDDSAARVFADRKALEAACLEQPNVTRLCRELGYEGVFLDVEELVEKIRPLMGKNTDESK